jgi:hypothetical protein
MSFCRSTGEAANALISYRRPNAELTPLLVTQIEFTERTPDGHLRHSSFTGLPHDKEGWQIRRE